MPIEDENVDPIYQKMVAAWEGEPETWGRINRALRDAMVDHAVRTCRYYRKAVPAGGRFRDIPILTKELIREHLDDLLAEGVPEDRRVPKRTSGSTGEPGFFYRDSTQGPMEYVSAQRFLLRLHGVPDGPVKVWVSNNPVGEQPDDRGFLGRRGRRPSRVHPVAVLPLTPRRLRSEVRAWQRFPSYFLYGPASAVHWVAERIEEEGLEVRSSPVVAITTADTLTGPAQERIERRFRCPVHSWYGSHEFNGYLAGTVPGARRYVFNPLLVHLEILDEGGHPASVGATGRLVLTDLNNYVMPFLRYDTGDVAVVSPDASVGGWPLVEEIVGRSAEVLRLPSGRVVTPLNLNNRLFVVRALGAHVRHYQCAQRGPNRFELRVAWRGEPPSAVRAEMLEAMREVVDPDSEVRLRDTEEPDRLPSGKVWIVRREL